MNSFLLWGVPCGHICGCLWNVFFLPNRVAIITSSSYGKSDETDSPEQWKEGQTATLFKLYDGEAKTNHWYYYPPENLAVLSPGCITWPTPGGDAGGVGLLGFEASLNPQSAEKVCFPLYGEIHYGNFGIQKVSKKLLQKCLCDWSFFLLFAKWFSPLEGKNCHVKIQNPTQTLEEIRDCANWWEFCTFLRCLPPPPSQCWGRSFGSRSFHFFKQRIHEEQQMGGKALGDVFEVAKVLKFSLAGDIAVFLQRKLFRQITSTSQPHGYNKFFWVGKGMRPTGCIKVKLSMLEMI